MKIKFYITEFIESKYANKKCSLKIMSTVSTYLSGAGDREGGKMMRT